MAFSVLDIVKILPGANCGKCGYATCMAFAIAVLKDGVPLENCQDLSREALGIAKLVREQQKIGTGTGREAFDASVLVMRQKIAPLDFALLAPGLGAQSGEENGARYLAFNYFGKPVKVFKDHIIYPEDMTLDPWDDIFLYNFICSQGNASPTGRWISFNELPGALNSSLALNLSGQNMLTWNDEGVEILKQRAYQIGAWPAPIETSADLALMFQPLDMLPMLLLYYRAEVEEGMDAQLQFLFDANVGSYLDYEGAFFLVKRMREMLAE
jgi:hypothetical protein